MLQTLQEKSVKKHIDWNTTLGNNQISNTMASVDNRGRSVPTNGPLSQFFNLIFSSDDFDALENRVLSRFN